MNLKEAIELEKAKALDGVRVVRVVHLSIVLNIEVTFRRDDPQKFNSGAKEHGVSRVVAVFGNYQLSGSFDLSSAVAKLEEAAERAVEKRRESRDKINLEIRALSGAISK